MTGPVVGSARVEITGDLSSFTDSAEKDARHAMDRAAGAVREGEHELDAASRHAGEQAGESTAEGMGRRSTSGVKSRLGHLKSTVHEQFGEMAKVAVGAFAVDKAFDFVKESVKGWQDHQRVLRQTEAVIKSTGGAAKLSADQMGNLSDTIEKNTGVDGDNVLEGENLLATFTNIHDAAGKGNDVFSQATGIMTDMASAMGTSVKGQAVALGKALNDPIKGVAALGRVGVTFTDKQKAMIKTMVDTGKTADAQKVILGELRREFGGSAAAQETSGQKMAVAIHGLQDAIGQGLTPIIEHVANFLSNTVIPIITSVVTWLENNSSTVKTLVMVLGPLLVAWIAYSTYTKAAAAAQVILNAVLSANPIGVVIALIVGLVAVLVVAWKHSETFRRIVKDAMHAVGVAFSAVGHVFTTIGHGIASVFSFILRHWGLFLAPLTGGFSLLIQHWHDIWNAMQAAWGWADRNIFHPIGNAIGAIVRWFGQAKSTLGQVFSGFFDGLYNAAVHIFNWVATAWNNTAGQLHFTIPSWVPGIGGDGFGFPQMPTLAYRARGGDLGALTMVGEQGAELLLGGRTVVSNPSTPGGNFDAFANKIVAKVGGGRLHPEDLAVLGQYLAARPAVLVANGTELARTVNNANLRLGRR